MRITLATALFAFAVAANPAAAVIDTARIDEATGAKGTMNKEENVYKVSFPRDDVNVGVDGDAGLWTEADCVAHFDDLRVQGFDR